MSSFEEIMKKAPEYLSSRYNSDVSDAFITYCNEEEMDSIDLISDDVNTDDHTESAIVSALGDKFSWNDSAKESFLKSLRILIGLDEDTNSNKKVVLPQEINWTNTTKSDVETAQNYINKQCNNIFTADKSLIQLIAIGRKNNINIVPLLFDIYSRYRFSLKMSKINNKTNKLEGPDITHSTFCQKSKFLKSLHQKDTQHKKIYNSLVQTLNSYQHRINPGYKGPGLNKINDDINAFIEYTLCVSTMMKSLTQSNQSCLPLLVNIYI